MGRGPPADGRSVPPPPRRPPPRRIEPHAPEAAGNRGIRRVRVPRIRQNNPLAGTGGRCALALLHGHQVADIGQHRLEIRHFP